MRYLLKSFMVVALLVQLLANESHAVQKSCVKYCALAYRDCVAPTPWLKNHKSCSQLSPKLKSTCIANCRTKMIHCQIHDCSDPTDEFKAKMEDRLKKEKSVGSIENKEPRPEDGPRH